MYIKLFICLVCNYMNDNEIIIVVLLQVPIVPGVVSTVIPGVRCVFVSVHLKPSTSKIR